MIESREFFRLGRGTQPFQPHTEPATKQRPFGIRHATLMASGVWDGTDGFAYDDETQMLRLVHQTGDPEFDQRILAQVIRTRTVGATDTDGQSPTTPKDFGTDSD